VGACAALLAVALLRSAPYSYVSLTRDLLRGDVFAYRRETAARIDALATAEPGSDAVVAPIEHRPSETYAYEPSLGDLAAYFGLSTARESQQ